MIFATFLSKTLVSKLHFSVIIGGFREGSEFYGMGGPEVFRGPSFHLITRGLLFHTPVGGPSFFTHQRGGLVFSRHVFLKSV